MIFFFNDTLYFFKMEYASFIYFKIMSIITFVKSVRGQLCVNAPWNPGI